MQAAPSDRSKTHVLGKELRFLRPFDARSTQKMLRYKALTRCPNPRQGTKGSASPVSYWAEGPKRIAAGQRNHGRDR